MGNALVFRMSLFFTGQAAVVRACAQLLGGSLALVCDMLVRIKGGHANSVWRAAGGGLEALLLDGSVAVSVPYCWTFQGDGSVLVLHKHNM